MEAASAPGAAAHELGSTRLVLDDGGGALRLPPLARAAAQLLLHHLDELHRHAGPARVNACAADSSSPGAGTSVFGRLVVKGGKQQERCIGAPRGAAGPRRCCA